MPGYRQADRINTTKDVMSMDIDRDFVFPLTSPVFPADKDLEIGPDAHPLTQTSSIQVYIQLAEPILFLQGFEQHQWGEKPPGILRGSLIVRVLKPSKLKSINLAFKGLSRTEWPEGIPPKKQEFVELNDVVNHVWPFYQSDSGHVASGNSGSGAELDDLLRRSGASLVRPLKKNHTISSMSLNSTHSPSSGPNNTGNRSLSPIGNILKRATSPSPNSHSGSQQQNRSRSNTNMISDFLSATLSDNDSISMFSKNSTNTGSEQFVFQPADYVYSFEQTIPLSYPETIRATFGSVEYFLDVHIERTGAFKSNIHAKLPIKCVRTQSDSSVEETEPIAISRDWEDQLHYDIVIASKDIVLDAFLPIAFRVSPLDKVTLHRIRIYLTETLEYYCRNKKVHRLEPTRKFLLAEHKAPPLENLPTGSNPSKAKNLGNLLLDDTNGDIVSKEFEYQVFIPERLDYHQRVHPDTSYQNIKSNHWIKICLRLSRMIDGKRKHYEISIDSPIHVLNKLCSHANTLLPSYDTHTMIPGADASSFGNASVSLYHSSNFYFPKEIINSPVLSPDVFPLDEKVGFSPRSLSPVQNSKRTQHPTHLLHHKNDEDRKKLDSSILNSPELKSNLYQPENIQAELTSPQAVPLSPITSPLMRPIHLLRRPSFEPPPFDADVSPPPIKHHISDSIIDAPRNPPTYEEVLKEEGIHLPHKSATVPQFKVTSPQQSTTNLLGDAKHKGHDQEQEHQNDDGDIAFGFSFQGSTPGSPNLPGAVFRTNSPQLKPINLSPMATRRNSAIAQDNLPSTIKNYNDTFNDLNMVLGTNENHIENDRRSSTSSIAASLRSSLDTTNGYISRSDINNMEPLLQHSSTCQNSTTMENLSRSRDSIAQFTEHLDDTSVDITALYERNSTAWHPLQHDPTALPLSNHAYSLNVANGNQVLEDFKDAFGSRKFKKEDSATGTTTPQASTLLDDSSGDLTSVEGTPNPNNSSVVTSGEDTRLGIQVKGIINDGDPENTMEEITRC